VIGGFLQRAGLQAADLLARSLPRPLAYGLADLIGHARYRLLPERRALVSANLARVCEATGRPTRGASFRRLVRRAFENHARYYLEVLRIPHQSIERIGQMVAVEDWAHWEPILRSGAVVATLHLGNFEPYGSFLAQHDMEVVAPVEELGSDLLFDFMVSRRGTGHGVVVVPLSRSRRPMIEALRRGGIVGMAADRDVSGGGQPVQLFGGQVSVPSGAAALALLTGKPLIVGACWRAGEERFHARAWPVEVPLTGDRRTDAAALSQAMARRFEEAIAVAPEQWWAVFQPIWTDPGGSTP
jgi:phosphatidylinositol dimannoside acyltransferase